MEYNAEKVMMGLHSCTRGRKSNDDRPCLECPYEECNIVGGTSERQTKGTCQGWLMKDALALLRENDALIEALANNNAELESELAETHDLCEEKDADIERLQGALKAEERHNELTMETAQKALANARADTLSEIKTRFAMRYGTYTGKDMTPITEVFRLLDQIAKEMLEES